MTLPIITQGSVSQTSPTRSSIPLYSSHFQIQVLHSHLPFFSSFFNSSESLHPPPHNTQLMQNKIFTTCKICPTPKFWVVYASGADWLCTGHWALGTGRWCWRSEYQDQGTDQPQLSGSGLVSADNTNNPSDVQVDWMADGRSRHPNRCKQQMANSLKHFLLLCTSTPLLTT